MNVIVGAGPSGLAVAWELSKAGEPCLVVDREAEIGGCHRVRRTEQDQFREHGPRIYLSGYVNTRQWFQDMGLNYDSFFVPYHFTISSIGGQTLWSLTWWERLRLAQGFLQFMIKSTKTQTIGEFMQHYNFTPESQHYIDRLCRLTDGAGADRYTLHHFYQILNQNVLHQIYQPKKATDVEMLPAIHSALEKQGVQFKLDTPITDIQKTTDGFALNDGQIRAKRVILALPPQNTLPLLKNFKNAFGPYNELSAWTQATAYITYIPVTFHWPTEIALADRHGFPASDWGVVYIVLSEYFGGTTLVSAAITLPDAKSTVTGKTVNETSDSAELKSEVFRQLDFDGEPLALLSPGVWHDGVKWQTKDVAYVDTAPGYFPVRSSVPGLFAVGTQNGNSNYDFTSMESAVSNALVASSIILNRARPRLKRPLELKPILWLLIFVSLLLFVTA